MLNDAEILAETVAEPMVLGSVLDYRAHAELAAGRTEDAAALVTRSLAAYLSIGYQEGLASASVLAANLAVLAGEYERAEARCTKPSTCVDACATWEAQHPRSRRWPCSTTTGATGSAPPYTSPKLAPSGTAPAPSPAHSG